MEKNKGFEDFLRGNSDFENIFEQLNNVGGKVKDPVALDSIKYHEFEKLGIDMKYFVIKK